MVVNVTKISQKMKNKSFLSIEKTTMERKEIIIMWNTWVLSKKMYKSFLIFRLCKLPFNIFGLLFPEV